MNSISIATTCVGFSDYLEIVAPSWKFAKQVMVATKPDDEQTIEVCNRYGFDTYQTHAFDHGRNGEKVPFNKGRSLNLAIESLDDPQWLLITDSDIGFPQRTIEMMLDDEFDEETLYGVHRMFVSHISHVENVDPLQVSPMGLWEENAYWFYYKQSLPLGYFQFFKYGGQRYPDWFSTAASVDLAFANKWAKCEVRMDYQAYHMGHSTVHEESELTGSFFQPGILL